MTFTCRGCDATWAGLAMAHCGCCHETFTTTANFDRHRRDFACREPGAAGLIQDSRGVWHQPGNGRYTASAVAHSGSQPSAVDGER